MHFNCSLLFLFQDIIAICIASMQVTMPIIKRLIHALVPDTCIYGNTEGSIVCPACLPEIIITKRSSCFLCNRQTDNFATCRRCKRITNVSRVYIASYYEDSIKELISRLKYKNVVAAADPLANALLVEAGYEYDLILPVPSSTKRFRQRGYNQSVLIGRTLSKHMGIPYHEALGRFGDTRQVGANRKERLTQLEGMFYVRKPAHVHGQFY